MYNYIEHNCVDKIYEYGFILDYNIFYDDLIYLTWQETKDKYLSQVGR